MIQCLSHHVVPPKMTLLSRRRRRTNACQRPASLARTLVKTTHPDLISVNITEMIMRLNSVKKSCKDTTYTVSPPDLEVESLLPGDHVGKVLAVPLVAVVALGLGLPRLPVPDHHVRSLDYRRHYVRPVAGPENERNIN